jgi:hypothetical protein
MSIDKEIWKDVVGYEGYYQVSNHGRAKSVLRVIQRSNGISQTINEKILKASPSVVGYPVVTMSKDKNYKKAYVHRLIAESFIPNPENKSEVNHIDGNKENNHVDNLEWVTPSENCQHAYNTGLSHAEYGERTEQSKLSNNDVLDIVNAYRLNIFTQKEIADAYDVGESTIASILLGRWWNKITGIEYKRKKARVLDNRTVLDILNTYKSGQHTQVGIANMFNVSGNVVEGIVNGRYYKNVTGII